MASHSTELAWANAVLSYLKENVGVGYSTDTSRIAYRCNVEKGDQADLRDVLSRLSRCGLLERHARGSKLAWSWTGKEWDSTNPFRGATVPKYSNVRGVYRVTGSTYDKRDGIKSIEGWRWVKEDSCWTVPKLEANKVRIEAMGLGVEDYEMPESEPKPKTPTEYPNTPDPEEENTNAETTGTVIDTEAYSKIHNLQLREKFLREQLQAAQADIKKVQGAFADCLLAMAEQMKEMEKVKEAVRANVRTVEIKNHTTGQVITLENKVLPKVFQDVCDLADCRRNILIVGPAGCGKSYLAKLVYEALKLPRFGKVGGSEGLDETHLIGYSRPNLTNGKDKFVTTPFLDCFEKGGLCLLDEIDRANPNVMLVLNSALDGNGDLPIPARGDIAKKSEDFVCVATGNTYGRGADRMYAGANQLDESTIDRFRMGIVEMDYDPVIDMAVCPDDELREWCQTVREKINRFGGMRRIMSSRFMEDAYLMKAKKDWSLEKIQGVFFNGWSRDEKQKVMSA